MPALAAIRSVGKKKILPILLKKGWVFLLKRAVCLGRGIQSL